MNFLKLNCYNFLVNIDPNDGCINLAVFIGGNNPDFSTITADNLDFTNTRLI